MPKLRLVSNNTPVPEAESAKYTAAEQETIEAYQAVLAAGRYFKLYDATSPFPRIISGDNPEPLPLCFLSADFGDFCKETGRRLPAKPPTDAYLASPLQTVTGRRFFPNGPALIRAYRSRHRYVNTFRAFEPKCAAKELSPLFHEFMACLFPDTDERTTFIQYCAHMIQFPEVRPSWHVMLLSETGTGKGFLFHDILSPLLCEQTALLKKYAELLGRFANAMEGTILVQLDDCKSKREDVQTQMKSLMTEERVLLEQKGLAAGMVATYTRFFLASNEEVPLELDETERRWWIPLRLGYSNGLTGKQGRDDRQRLIKRLSKWLAEPGALEAIYDFFVTYPLDGFDVKCCPMTVTLQEQIEKSVTVEQAFAHEFIDRHTTKIIKSEELIKALRDAGMGNPGNKAISGLFASCGYRSDTLESGGRKSRWWLPMWMKKAEAEAILDTQPDF